MMLLAAVALLLPSAAIYSQNEVPVYETDTTQTDFRMRFGFDLKFKLWRGLSLSIEEDARLKNYLSGFDRSYTSATLAYRFNPYFKLGAGYTFMAIWHDGKKSTKYEKYWDCRQRVNLDIVGNISYMNWKFTLRERPLATFRTLSYDSGEKVSPEFMLRSKFEVEYTMRTAPLKPYFAAELSNTLNVPKYVERNYIDRIRLNLGIKWRLNKSNSIDFYYRFDIGNDKDVNIDYKKDDVTIKKVDIVNEHDYTHIIGIFYNFEM